MGFLRLQWTHWAFQNIICVGLLRGLFVQVSPSRYDSKPFKTTPDSLLGVVDDRNILMRFMKGSMDPQHIKVIIDST